jgi:hypothetical protein
LVIVDADGAVLFDGSVAIQRGDLTIDVVSDGRSGDRAELTIHSALQQPVLVHVTAWHVVDSDFIDPMPTDSTYTLRIASQCDGEAYLPCVVNGHSVAEPACGWLHYVGREVVPNLEGNRSERLTDAARVAWWSLKEGVLFLQNPIVYSNCHFSSGDAYIDPLETCAQGSAWQVGMSGIQVWAASLETLEGTATSLFPGLSSNQVLQQTAAEAGLDSGETAAVVASTGDLRRSWLMRTSAIGFTHQVGPVTRECIDDTRSWCFGTGWHATQLFAPDRNGAMQAIDDIRAMFDQLAP